MNWWGRGQRARRGAAWRGAGGRGGDGEFSLRAPVVCRGVAWDASRKGHLSICCE
jgi:hypothetical protein